MVSEDSNGSFGTRNFNQLVITTFQDLEQEIELLRNSINDLILCNRDLFQEVRELNSELSLIALHLDRTPTRSEGEEDQVEDQPVEAQPVEQEVRPLRIGDRVRITSRQHFGVVGEVHSFTNQRVRVLVEGRRRPLIRSSNNLQHIL